MDPQPPRKGRARQPSRSASRPLGVEKSAPHHEVASRLHWTQDCFWFSAALCLFLTTGGFTWRVWQGKRASIEWGNLRVTSEQAETFVGGARDRLLRARTQLDDAVASNNFGLASNVVQEFDEVLKTLGVAKEALEKQQVAFGSGAFYDDAGYDYGGYGYNDYKVTPTKKKSAERSPTP